MTDDEKQAIETLKTIKRPTLATGFERQTNLLKALGIVLNLIEKQQAELKKVQRNASSKCSRVNSAFKQKLENDEDLEMLYKGCQIELEEKDKRISNLEFALMDMVLQFADENKDSINTMGLSALETAFNELNFDNPMSIKEVHKRYKELAQKYYQ